MLTCECTNPAIVKVKLPNGKVVDLCHDCKNYWDSIMAANHMEPKVIEEMELEHCMSMAERRRIESFKTNK